MKHELFVFIPELLSCDGDLEIFLTKCKEAGATGLRVFFQFAWDRNILSPYKLIGYWKAGYPDAPDMPFYDQLIWDEGWENKVRNLLSTLQKVWPECKLVATLHDYCSFKAEGWRKYLYPFLSSSPDRDINMNEPEGGFLPGGFWGMSGDETKTVQFLHRRYARKVISLMKEYGIDFYIEFCNEDGVEGWDDEYAHKYYKWVYQMLKEEGMPSLRFIVSGRYAAYVPGAIYSQHGIISAKQIKPEKLPLLPTSEILLSGDGGWNGGSGPADERGRKGLGYAEIPELVETIKKEGFFGYEYMDRGMWRDNDDRANLDYFDDKILLELAKGLGTYEEPKETKIKVVVCKLSGLLPTECCKELVEEEFILGDEPFETCYIHRKIDVALCSVSRKLPSPWCKRFNIVSMCYADALFLLTCSVCQPPCKYWWRIRNFKQWLKCIVKKIKIIKGDKNEH